MNSLCLLAGSAIVVAGAAWWVCHFSHNSTLSVPAP